MKTFSVGFNGQVGGFEIHKLDCADLKKPKKLWELNGKPWTREAETPKDALEAELREDFGSSDSSDDGKYPEYPRNSFGAAGFGDSCRIFPCAYRD